MTSNTNIFLLFGGDTAISCLCLANQAVPAKLYVLHASTPAVLLPSASENSGS